MNDTRALVLGGGGVAGIAWETGVLFGLAEEGVEVTTADVVIGTSAGSTVAAQVTSGTSLEMRFHRQFTSVADSGELAAQLDVEGITAMFVEALQRASTPTELRIEIGQASVAAPTVAEGVRRAVIERRLPVHEWPPGRDLRIVAVAAENGATRVFTELDGVSIVDAVAASCAVPGVWPPVTIQRRRYIDGGVRTSTNADLAAACNRILVLAPAKDVPMIADDIALADMATRAKSPGYLIISPDEESLAAIGPDSLDLGTRAPTATAGRAQGRAIAADVIAMWIDQ